MCWHKWSKWTQVREGVLAQTHSLLAEKGVKTYPPEQPRATGDWFIEQKRDCSKCGKIQLRTVLA